MPTYKELQYSAPDPEMYDDYYEDCNVDLYDNASVVDEFVSRFPKRDSYAIYKENHDEIIKGLQGDHILQMEDELNKLFPVYYSFLYNQDSLTSRFLLGVYFLRKSVEFTNKYDAPYSIEDVKQFVSNIVDVYYLSYEQLQKIKKFLEVF